jgi:Ca2+-binding EF-hand superfamily protein
LMKSNIKSSYRKCSWFGALRKCFDARDRNRQGSIPLSEFRGVIRRDLSVPVDAVGDADIRRLFTMFPDGNTDRLHSKSFCDWILSS